MSTIHVFQQNSAVLDGSRADVQACGAVRRPGSERLLKNKKSFNTYSKMGGKIVHCIWCIWADLSIKCLNIVIYFIPDCKYEWNSVSVWHSRCLWNFKFLCLCFLINREGSFTVRHYISWQVWGWISEC